MGDTCCCGWSLQLGARIIAFVDILLAFCTVVSLLFFDKLTELLHKYFNEIIDIHYNEEDDLSDLIKEFNPSEDPSTGIILIIVCTMLYVTMDVSTSALLLHGANSKRISSCRWWFRLRVFMLLAFIVYFFIEMGRSRLFLYGVFDILKIFYRFYCLSTVSNFVRKLERDEFISSRRRRSIVVPYVQVITPEGSYSALFPTPAEYNNFFNINGQNNGLILTDSQQEEQSDSDNNDQTSLLDK
ncbi:unnamed protein product [Allacma fusca]|uniref:Uncharacterized protein n=1 Tax=Allacma fusca TaxID=39272 RepID=A0A8J2JHW5_9HEXA|nr:unnamed protein product [Allacma fusca]